MVEVFSLNTEKEVGNTVGKDGCDGEVQDAKQRYGGIIESRCGVCLETWGVKESSAVNSGVEVGLSGGHGQGNRGTQISYYHKIP